MESFDASRWTGKLSEQEWLASSNSIDLIHHLSAIGQFDPTNHFSVAAIRASERKLRLFGLVCCRRVQHWSAIPIISTAIERAERFADEEGGTDELDRLQEAAANIGYPREATNDPVFGTTPFRLARAVSLVLRHDDGWDYYTHIREIVSEIREDDDSEAAIANLLREIFGNPFRPVAIDHAWLTSDVLALARGIYGERAFDRLPILADALQDAGCDNTDILNHCRSCGPHVRGCWAVDLVLGKA